MTQHTCARTHHIAPLWLQICIKLVAVVGCLLAGSQAFAGCMDQKRLLGVNLAGGEFGADKIPGVLFKDYIYPSRQDMAYFKSQGMNIVRVPFLWERVQRQVNGTLDSVEIERLQTVVRWAQDMDVCILLDLHNYGTYKGRALGSADVPASAFIDVWLRLHQVFNNPDETAFGLMNEPAALPVPLWMQIAQQTVLALRNDGAKNLLLVPSGRWSGAHEWDKPFDGLSAASAFRNFQDPLNNYVIELHQYTDSNFSGTSANCMDPARLRDILAKVTTWAKQEKKRFLLGEFGVAKSTECLATLQAMLEAMQDSSAWQGWTYWSAGPWWGNYPLSIQPQNNQEAPQIPILRQYTNKSSANAPLTH
jgi:endoglucanase